MSNICYGKLKQHTYDAMWCEEKDARVEVPDIRPVDDGHTHKGFWYETPCGHWWGYGTDVSQMSFTADCKVCDKLLIMKDGTFKDFHVHMHEQNPNLWPADGTGTGYIELGEV